MSMEETAQVDPRLCACGSGLRSIRCCGQDISLKATPMAARHVAPLADQAAAVDIMVYRMGLVVEQHKEILLTV